jgi:hypothetical protein
MIAQRCGPIFFQDVELLIKYGKDALPALEILKKIKTDELDKSDSERLKDLIERIEKNTLH